MNDADLLGKKLGVYQVQQVLGRGGMGVVFKAIDLNLHRPVALKVLPSEFSYDESFVARFLLEARAAAQLNHPNIVTIYAIGEENGVHYIAMEYIEGRTVEQTLKANGPLPPEKALAIVRQCTEALREAHSRNMIHRDIKPSNIMIDSKGVARVMDFGLVSAQSAGSKLTAAGTLMGTPSYIAPEVYNGQHPDKRVDLYALGITFFEMLTGSTPYHSETPAGMMYHALNTPIPHDALKKKGVPGRIQKIVEALTQKDPGQRIGSADDLLALIDTGKMPKPKPSIQVNAPTIKMDRGQLLGIPNTERKDQWLKLGKVVAVAVVIMIILVAINRVRNRRSLLEETPPLPTVTQAPVIPASLADWAVPDGADTWRIEENAITATSLPGSPPAKMQSLDWWRDFTLEMELKALPDSFGSLNLRSGVKIELRTNSTLPEDDHSKIAKDAYGEVSAQADFSPDAWHKIRLKLVKNQLETTLNGELLTSALPVEASTQPAAIELAISAGSFWYRNITHNSLDLPPNPPRRTVEFPDSPLLGKCIVWPAGEFLSANLHWFGDAKGKLPVSRGMELGLLPQEPGLHGMRFLDLVPVEHLNGVIISATPFTSRDLRKLSLLPSLTKLAFISSGMSAEQMTAFPQLPILDQLLFAGESGINDEALLALPHTPSLKMLMFENCGVSAEKFAPQAQFPTLLGLSFRGSALNSRSLSAFGRHETLRYLDLSETPFPSDNLAILGGLPSLESLDLSLCSLIENSALEHLFGTPSSLRHLNLSYTGVSRAALLEQGKSETLKSLSCIGLGFTSADLEILKQNFPNCEIKY